MQKHFFLVLLGLMVSNVFSQPYGKHWGEFPADITIFPSGELVVMVYFVTIVTLLHHSSTPVLQYSITPTLHYFCRMFIEMDVRPSLQWIFQLSNFTLIHRNKIHFGHPANWAGPVVGNIIESSSGWDTCRGITFKRIVNVTTHRTTVLGHIYPFANIS